MIYCSRCGNTFEDAAYEGHLVKCVLRSRVFRRRAFRGARVRDVAVGRRPVVRRPDFTSPDSPSVPPVLQEERVDAGLRSRRIRTVHVPLTVEDSALGSRRSRWRSMWDVLMGRRDA